MPERLQKILAQAGYGSRRAREDFIAAGRVRVNGKIAELGQKADPAVDKITVDGKPIAAAEALTYIAPPQAAHGLIYRRSRTRR